MSVPYYCLDRKGGVICLLLSPEGDVLLAKQYRPPLGRHTLELPAGAVEPGESPEQAAAREVEEEVGCRCRYLLKLTPCRVMINREDAVEHFFVGLDTVRIDGHVTAEPIEMLRLSRGEFRDFVVSGTFDQTVALGALYVVEKRYGIDLLGADITTLKKVLLDGSPPPTGTGA